MSSIALEELLREVLENNTRPLARKPTVALFQVATEPEKQLFQQRAAFVFPRLWPNIEKLFPRYTKRNDDVAASFHCFGDEFILEYREWMNRWAIHAPNRPGLNGFKAFENNHDTENHVTLFMGTTLSQSGKLAVPR